MPASDLLYRRPFPAAELLAAHPPRLTHPHKQLLFDVAALSGPPTGTVVISRWAARPLPEGLEGDVGVAEAEGWFDYADPEPGTVDWWQNFADPLVFGFYAGGLYAQDEMMCAEHPILGSVHEHLRSVGHHLTVAEGPTPILVVGAERRVTVDTAPAPGRQQGLYGNHFAAASTATIRGATKRIVPPTRSNVLAVAAPHPASGAYTAAQIRSVLHTAVTGYAAAVAESARLWPGARVVVHTGFWGCGAFGGNRPLMIALQTVAARLAGVHTLVLHVGDRGGLRDSAVARRLLARLPAAGPLAGFVAATEALGLPWGHSDGT